MSWEYNYEPKIAEYLSQMTESEKAKLARVEMDLRTEVDIQLMLGRDNYENLLFVDAGTMEFRHIARRLLKKAKPLVRVAED
ncbi:hypothetical protein HZA97_08315 [Candidatus Woesearchaeota archaeon]|nr:hypothetical protein [Candidatus Woesearchaeota archaeon]